MANRTLFKNKGVSSPKNPKGLAVTLNEAGGEAFAFADKHALAQYAVTGTFGNAFYTDAETQLEKVIELAKKVDSTFVAKLAVYAHEQGRMKDMPAYLLAILHARGENVLLANTFARVVSSFKMLCNFVQIVRSGAAGRKSFGSFTKRLIQTWLQSRDADDIFKGSIGQANPSVADIIKMVHPTPSSKARDAVFAYLIDGKDYDKKKKDLPKLVKAFEKLKEGKTEEIPDVPFRALTNLSLSVDNWRAIAKNMPWNTFRMNLNMLHKRGVFSKTSFLEKMVAKLADADSVRKSKTLPYALFTAYQNTEDIPVELRNALQDAAEVATENVPTFDGNVVLAIDVSGSMGAPVTGNRGTVTTKTRCVDVAGVMASCVLRQNKNARVIMFDTGIHTAKLNPRDSIMTNAAAIARFGGGGTDTSLPLALLNREGAKPDLVIYVSDNESWSGRRLGTATQWDTLKKRVPTAKLVNIDIQPYASSQVPDQKDVLNIGGFSDAIWSTIAEFSKRGANFDFVGHIEKSVTLG